MEPIYFYIPVSARKVGTSGSGASRCGFRTQDVYATAKGVAYGIPEGSHVFPDVAYNSEGLLIRSSLTLHEMLMGKHAGKHMVGGFAALLTWVMDPDGNCKVGLKPKNAKRLREIAETHPQIQRELTNERMSGYLRKVIVAAGWKLREDQVPAKAA